jgi:hypothetical protein
MGFLITELADTFEAHRKGARADHLQCACDIGLGRAVDLADEAQSEMKRFGVDPARARNTAAKERKRRPESSWKSEGGEQARHRDCYKALFRKV